MGVKIGNILKSLTDRTQIKEGVKMMKLKGSISEIIEI